MRKVFFLGLFLFSFEALGHSIKKELEAYFHPSLMKQYFYTHDEILLHAGSKTQRVRHYTRRNLEMDLVTPVVRFPVASFAPEEIVRLKNRDLTGYTPEEQKKAYAEALAQREKELGKRLDAKEKEALWTKIMEEKFTCNDNQADEAEGLALIHRTVSKLLQTFLDFDNFDTFPVIKASVKHAEEISPVHLKKNHPGRATELTRILSQRGIFPIPANTYYQYSKVFIQKPSMAATLHFGVKHTSEQVQRGLKELQIPTIRIFWKIDRRFDDIPEFASQDALVNSGFLELQPYVNAESTVFDGPQGLPGPAEPITLLTYHIYVKFDPENKNNIVTSFFPAAREQFIGKFIEDLVQFLRKAP